MKITNKLQMYSLLRTDKLGNHFEWISFNDWMIKPYNKRCGFVHSVRFGNQLGAPWKYHLLADDVLHAVLNNPYGCKLSDVSVVTMPLLIHPILNAELMRAENGLEMFYSTHLAVMRESLAHGGRTTTGVSAKVIITEYCDPASVDDLMQLLETYEDAVIEFSVFSRDVGVMPHRNTVVWEVRNY